MQRNAHRRCGIARRLGFFAWGCTILPGAIAGPELAAQAPTLDPTITAIEPLLQSESAEMRGEAALALAATGEAKYYTPILELATDPEPACRHRAILALGYLRQPGADAVFAKILDKAKKDSLDRLLATLALGMLPDDHLLADVDQFFNRARAASRKRIRNELVCMLLGLMHETHPRRMTQLREFLSDATYRNSPVVALVIGNLAKVHTQANRDELLEQLHSGNATILVAALEALARPRVELTAKQRKRIARLAERHGSMQVRAAALHLLTFHRDPTALGIAGRVLQSKDPTLLAAAIRTILRLGGGALRKDVEDRILVTEEPHLKAAMLRAKIGPHGDAFVRKCLSLATDGSLDFVLRVQAAKIVAEAGWKQIAPAATHLFLTARKRINIVTLARALTAIDKDIATQIYPPRSIEDTAMLSTRLYTLLVAGHEQAIPILLDILGKSGNRALELEAVRAYRRARLSALDADDLRLAPEAVRELLQ